MIMFFDVETTGLPKDWKAPMTDLENWPRVIQLAWASTDGKGNPLKHGDFLIAPDGWVIPQEQFWIEHGFNTATNAEKGHPIAWVLDQFIRDLQECDFLVAHNMSYDYNVLGSEMIRAGKSSEKKPTRICTKEASVHVCKIPFAGQRNWPGRRGGMQYKWPKLEELHRHLFGRDFDDAHDAGGDVAALKNCFFALCSMQIINITPDGVAIR